MNPGIPQSPRQNIRIGETLKNNESITYSEPQSPVFHKTNPYGAQIYLHNNANQDKRLEQKYLLVCMQVERLTKILSKHQTVIFELTQEIQIKITDTESYREKQDILQRELKRIQEEDKALLGNNHRLEQMLLQKNRLTAMLQEQLIMARNKVNSTQGKDSIEQKNRIRQLERLLIEEKSKNSDLDRLHKEAVINLQRAETRMNTKLGNDRTLLINAQNRIKQLQEQLRVYVSQKRMLEQNQMRFSQQHKNLEQSKILQYSRQIQKLQGFNSNLVNQKNQTSGQVSTLQKQVTDMKNQLKIKTQNQTQYFRQISSLQNQISSLNTLVNQKQRRISFFNNEKSQMQYQLQTSQQQLRRMEQRYNSQNYTCKLCPQLQSQNKGLISKIKRLEQFISTQENQHKVVIRQSEKDIKNLRELLQSVNNLKGSNERVSRLIEVSASKLIRTSSSKGFFSASTLM